MKSYLTISEFASLRNVNINSLRYYEKLKLLVPAYIEPQTKYRYYLPEQLVIMDVITLAIRLDFPLKKLKDYIDDEGKIDNKSLFTIYQKMLTEKIKSLQTGLNAVQYTLNTIEQNESYRNYTGVYEREIDERFLIAKKFDGATDDIAQKEKFSMDLFLSAQKKKMSPLFPAGIILGNEKSRTETIFFQILKPPASDKNIIRIPKTTFSCLQVDIKPETNLIELIDDCFPPEQRKLTLITNMDLNKLSFNSKHTEIQVLIK